MNASLLPLTCELSGSGLRMWCFAFADQHYVIDKAEKRDDQIIT